MELRKGHKLAGETVTSPKRAIKTTAFCDPADTGPIFEFPDSKFALLHALSGSGLIFVAFEPLFFADWFCL